MTKSGWSVLQQRLLLRYEDLKLRLTRRLGSSDLASDALQETWLRLQRGGELAPLRSPDTYLERIAVNIARDRMRVESRRLTTSEVETLLGIADEAPDAARTVEARSDLQALKAVLAELPLRQRAILLAARLEGLSRRDIAARHGISIRLVQRELQEAQDYCAARLRKLVATRFRSAPRETSLEERPSDAEAPEADE
jgi:RNA polymerase sigma-70 factor (ECF subfamily)